MNESLRSFRVSETACYWRAGGIYFGWPELSSSWPIEPNFRLLVVVAEEVGPPGACWDWPGRRREWSGTPAFDMNVDVKPFVCPKAWLEDVIDEFMLNVFA